MNEKQKYLIPSVNRTINIIRYMSDHREGVGQSELIAALGYPENSIFRILKTLAVQGLVRKIEGSSKFVLGDEFCLFGFKTANRYSLMDVAMPIMQKLAQKTRETVQLFTNYQGNAMMIHQIESVESLKVVGQIGSLYEMHCSSPGKVMLANMQEEEFDNVINTYGTTPRTTRGSASIYAIRKELEEVKKNGYAIDDQEYQTGLRCIAAPVHNYLGQVIAALNISGPDSRINNNTMQMVIEFVTDAAREISTKLGYVTEIKRDKISKKTESHTKV